LLRDIRKLWDGLIAEQQGEVVRSLLVMKVLPVKVRGSKRFDPDAIEIEWKI
jgi:hypothetical protein